MKVFQFLAFHNPPAKKDERPPAKIIVDLTTILARDEKEAMFRAARAVPQEFVDKLSEVEIVVRPF